jgi:hypothetical protein
VRSTFIAAARGWASLAYPSQSRWRADETKLSIGAFPSPCRSQHHKQYLDGQTIIGILAARARS